MQQHLPHVVQTLVGLRERVALIAAGGEHSLAVTDKGVLYAWGSGQCGRLGLASDDDQSVPMVVTALQRAKVRPGPGARRTGGRGCTSIPPLYT